MGRDSIGGCGEGRKLRGCERGMEECGMEGYGLGVGGVEGMEVGRKSSSCKTSQPYFTRVSY